MSAAETPSKIKVFPVIGLEVHAQLQTRSKIFCACPVTFGAPPNSAICPVCLGFPGTLPVLNREMVTLALRLATAAGATIHPRVAVRAEELLLPGPSEGLPDLAVRPAALDGRRDRDRHAGGREARSGSSAIHLEEDAGKSMHDIP